MFNQCFRCILVQHPRLRWNRRKRAAIMEKYKRAFIRHHKLIYGQREKRYIHNYLHHAWDDFLISNRNEHSAPFNSLSARIAKALKEHSRKRLKRALKGGSGSRAFGTSHKSSNSQLSLRRSNKKIKNNIDDEKPENELGEPKRPKHKNRGPCEPLSSEPFVNVEVVKYGRDPNVSFSPGTIVKMACGKGYGLNIPENKTAKCVRGRWRPTKPMCLICKFTHLLSKFSFVESRPIKFK